MVTPLSTWLLHQASSLALVAAWTPWPMRAGVMALHAEVVARAREAGQMEVALRRAERALDEIVADAREDAVLTECSSPRALAELDAVLGRWRRM